MGKVYYENMQETEEAVSRALYNLSMISHGPAKAGAISEGVKYGVMLGNDLLESKGFTHMKGDNLRIFEAEVFSAAAAYGYCRAARDKSRVKANNTEDYGFHGVCLGRLHVYGDVISEKGLEDAFNRGYDAVGTG